jgi:probable HAF family extracellular repeat protein
MRTHSHSFGLGAAAKWLLALIAVLALVPAGGHRAASQSQYLTVALGPLSEARALNASGQVTGLVYSAAGGAFVWDQGVKTSFGPPDTRAMSINASGHVVGISLGRAFIWRNGIMSDLGTPGSLSIAHGINDADQVVGSFYPPGFVPVQGIGRAFLWQNGVTTDLGTLGGLESRALGINNAGQVVGEAMTAQGIFHAFLRTG